MVDEDDGQRGFITTEHTVWCGNCGQWNTRSGAGKALEEAGLALYKSTRMAMPGVRQGDGERMKVWRIELWLWQRSANGYTWVPMRSSAGEIYEYETEDQAERIRRMCYPELTADQVRVVEATTVEEP